MLPFSSDATDSAARVAVAHLLASGLWILSTDFSTSAVARSSAKLTLVQTAKAMAFVTLSAALPFVLVGCEQRRLASANADLEPWVVRFIVTDSGGSIAVKEEPVDGTVVRLGLLAAET